MKPMLMLRVLGLLVAGLAPTIALAGGLDPDDVARRQDEAMYVPRGLRTFVSEVKCSAWAQDQNLANVSLTAGWPREEFEASGVKEGQKDSVLLLLMTDYYSLRELIGRSSVRVSDLMMDFEVACTEDNGRANVSAKKRRDGGEAFETYEIVIGHDGELLRLRSERDTGITVMCEKYSYCEKDGRRLPEFYCMVTSKKGPKGEEAVEFAEVRLAYEKVEGFWLPIRVEKKAHAPGEEGGTTVTYTIDYTVVNGSSVKARREEGGLFSTPESTVKTFFQGAANRDMGLMAKCFSPNAPEEFEPILGHTATDEMLEELKAVFGAAEVISCEVHDGTAEVRIRFREPGDTELQEETMELVRDGDEWKILDF